MLTGTDIHADGLSLGERMKQRRKELGWTQERLGEESGTTQAVIQKIENGKSLRPRKLDEIADALDVDPAWLMFGKKQAGSLDTEAMEVARAWSRLNEPHRSQFKDTIVKMASESESEAA